MYDSDYIVVKLVSGAAPKDMKYVFLGAGGGTALIDNYDTLSPTVFGHAEAADAAGVGAVEYDESPSYFLNPPAPEFYSSAGGTPIYFDANGNRLGSPVTRQQPRFSSIDGSDNTFLGADLDFNNIPNFSGTSAAAPHAAALAALMLQANPSLTPAQIFTILQDTSLPLDSGDGTPNVGYSFDGGWGLIQGDRALAAVEPRTVSGIVYKDTGNVGHYVAGDPVAAGATVYMDIAGNGHLDSGSTSVGTTTPLTIPFQPDPTQGPTRVSSPLSVSGIPGLITHLSVTLDISAVEDFNLGVTLVSPTGIRIPLIEQTGPGISDFPNVTIDDTGLDSVEDPGIIDFTNGTFEPDVELSALIGENPNGTWHLEGRDFGITPGADSTLNSWSLNINYADPVATTNSQGKFTFAGPYVDANGSPIVGLAPAAYTGPINVGVQGFPGYNVQINASTSASFLKQDVTTKGSWVGTYGAQGYDIVSGPSSLPSNDSVTPSGQSTYAWTTTTTDPRALQVPGSSNRVAAVWYSSTKFTIDVNLADGQTHDLELYFLDWDNKGRSEQVQISNAGTGTVLDTETISSFTSGVYLDWKVSGHLLITITRQAGDNAVVNGLFLDSTAPPPASASFLKQDVTTKGSWVGTYGAQGYDIVSGPSSLPSNDSVTPSGQSTYAWTTTTTDPRALQVPGSSNRVAAVWYSSTKFTIDVNLADGQTHDLELYFLDWDNKGRSEQVQISNAGTGTVLDTETISSFTSGVYLDWKVSGHLLITITRQAGDNAVVNGLFLDSTAPPPASASFLKQDVTTKGSWVGTYGAQGYDIVSGPSSLPSNDSVTPSGQSTYAWTTTTTDPRALQVPGSSNRVAAVWYSSTKFTIDVNLADGQTHDLELYFLDWDNKGRSEQVQISNAGTGTVLDTETISSFTSGVYLDWKVSGHLLITITRQAGDNAVVNGLFLDSTAPPPASASFLKQDVTTKGSWVGTYGAQGYDIVSGPSSLPSNDSVTPSGQSTYAWTTTTTDPRALQVPGSSNRVAAVWYSSTKFTIDVNLADGQTHDLELYFLDWDNKGRSEQVQISNAGTGTVLDTETISSFTSGVYLDWKVSGHLLITITRQAGDNAVVNGLFLDAPA